MNSVDKVRSILKSRSIPVSRMEKDLGYSNGYLNGLKKGTLPNDRLKEIAEYLSISASDLLDEDAEIPKSPFEAYISSLGYKLIQDDPEHPEYLEHDGDAVQLSYGDMDELMMTVDKIVSNQLENLYMKRLLVYYNRMRSINIDKINAAHQLVDASQEDIQHDNDIMDGRDF